LRRMLSRIGGLIVHPEQTVSILVHERPGLGEALLFILLFSLSRWISVVLASKHLLYYVVGFLPIKGILDFAFNIVAPMALFGGIISDLLLWVVISVGSYVILRAIGKITGGLEEGLSLIGYSWIGSVFIVVPSILVPFLPIAGMVAMLLGAVIGLIWGAYIASLALSKVYGVSFATALIAIVLTGLVLMAIFTLPLALQFLIFPWRFLVPWWST